MFNVCKANTTNKWIVLFFEKWIENLLELKWPHCITSQCDLHDLDFENDTTSIGLVSESLEAMREGRSFLIIKWVRKVTFQLCRWVDGWVKCDECRWVQMYGWVHQMGGSNGWMVRRFGWWANICLDIVDPLNNGGRLSVSGMTGEWAIALLFAVEGRRMKHNLVTKEEGAVEAQKSESMTAEGDRVWRSDCHKLAQGTPPKVHLWCTWLHLKSTCDAPGST